MPYLICENCGGYYEISEGESHDDYDHCPCGGKLRLVKSIYGRSPQADEKILNKTTIILGILFITLLSVAAIYLFAPDPWKMDFVIPNKVGTYEVPSSEDLQSRTGSFYSEPVKVMAGGNSLTKYYLSPDSNVLLMVGIIHTDDVKVIKQMKLRYEGLPEETRVIGGKNFEGYYYKSYELDFYGNNYIMNIIAASANPSSPQTKSVLQMEASNFADKFIPEFDRSNIFYR